MGSARSTCSDRPPAASHAPAATSTSLSNRSGDQFNAFDLIDVKTIPEKRLDTRVDLTTRDGLHPRLREQIEREAIRVF